METKSASRSLKKNANTGPGTAGDRKKAKQKKKKEKRKQSLKGTESTDIPSPELDSEVPFDGDATLTDQGEGERSSAGQVTKLPHLTHSAVSLTTQVLPTDTASTTTTTNSTSNSTLRKLQLGQASSAPTLRTSEPIATTATKNDSSTTTTTTTTTVAPTAPGVDGVVARVASLNIKQRSSKPRSKTQSKASSKSTRTRDRQNNAPNKQNSNASANNNGGLSTSTTAKTVCSVINESLRWEYVLEDVDKERERIALYKLNRRKRYLAAAQAKGLRWAMNYNTHITVSPMSEDSGVDTTYGSPAAYLDFAPMTSLRPMPAHRGLQEAFVEC